jgi:GH43 family beta-xylosidase
MTIRNAALTVLSIFAVLAGSGSNPAIAAMTFTNPLLDSGPDPWVTYYRGYYYYTNTLGDRLQIWKTTDITRLRSATARVVWRAPPTGANSASIWAPELHRLAGKWYLYYTAADRAHNDDEHRRQFVLENPAADPLSGRWIERGVLATAHTGIDGTVFSDKGRLYFVYSAYVGLNSDLIIAAMINPWTLSATQIDIAQPILEWEKQGGRQILEGPEFLPGRRGQRLLVYSASACWSDDYSIGLLVAEPGADLLDPASWKKLPEPVFKASTQSGVYAPGHNGFFKSPDGKEDWIIYHANSGPGQRCDNRRSPRIQKFSWREDGLPDFGVPSPTGVPIQVPSGQ